MNWRAAAYLTLVGLRGQPLGANYYRYQEEDRKGIPAETTRGLLIKLLEHCQRNVPYYASIIAQQGDWYRDDPEEYLRRFPLLTKSLIREKRELLTSTDLKRRKWYRNTSGGSTGEPVILIQDREYAARIGAITLLFSHLVGGELGELEVNLWASLRDIRTGTESWRARLVRSLIRSEYLNATEMTPESMRAYIGYVNQERPKLIIGYVNSLHELACFAEQVGMEVIPQSAIISTAGTLSPMVREKIETVFKCRVYDRYGSREVGDIAFERPGFTGLWVAPWGNYIEILDDKGNPVPEGTEGNIAITSLTNYAMPLIRYMIGDMGILAPDSTPRPENSQLLLAVTGRLLDYFRSPNGTYIHTSFFIMLLFFRDWIKQYQVIQKDYLQIVIRFVLKDQEPTESELLEIKSNIRKEMGEDCSIDIEFVDHIAASPSGKYRYTICEIDG